LIGVQARSCAPLWEAFTEGKRQAGTVQEGETIAEGIRIMDPVRADAVLSAVTNSRGKVVAVDEESIQAGRTALAKHGLYVEATSAVVWPALRMTLSDLRDPVVVVLTGSGLKNPTL
jgi:threonine synthase